MSDQRDEGGAGGGGRTIQVDAMADADAVLEDSVGEDDESPAAAFDGPPIVSRAPPPLPKRGPTKGVVIAALAVVMVLSIGAAFGASHLLAPAPAAPTAPPVLQAPTETAPAARPRSPVTIEEIEITGGEDAGADEDGADQDAGLE